MQARKNFSGKLKMGPLAMFSWVCAKVERATVFGLNANLDIVGAVGLGCGIYFLLILTTGLGLDQAAFWRSRLDHGK